MAFPQGMAYYPGVQAVLALDVVRGHGIAPQPITLTMTPQQQLPQRQGNLYLEYGTFRMVIRDCISDQVQFKFDQSGYIWQIVLLDRRWKWQYLVAEGKSVSGRFNIRLPHGPVEIMDPKTKKSARDIIRYCLREMGELQRTRFVGAVPELYPEVNWDRENPARALQQILDICGLRLVLRYDDSILITKPGVNIYGQRGRLPTGPVIYDNASYNPPECPSEIHLVCGPTRFQGDFYCEAVGDDVDGLVVPIEELTYKPPAPGGWEYGNVIEWLDVPLFKGSPSVWKSLQRPRELARASVFRKYRVTLKAFSIPGYRDKKKIKSTDEILPIGQQLIEPTFDKKDGWYKPVETMVWGVFAFGSTNNSDEDNILDNAGNPVPPWKFKPKIVIPEVDPVTGSIIPGKKTTLIPQEEYSLDSDTGIITFNRLVYRYVDGESSTGTPRRAKKPAALWIRCGVCVNDPKTRQPIRHTEKIKIPGAPRGAGVLEIRDDTLFVRVEPKYSPGRPDSISGTKDNLKIIKAEARKRLEAEAAKFQQIGPSMRTYACWGRYDLDGAVQQVAYHLDFTGKATMSACLNDELTILTMPYQERRFYEKMQTYTEELSNVMRFAGQYRYPFSNISNIARRGR